MEIFPVVWEGCICVSLITRSVAYLSSDVLREQVDKTRFFSHFQNRNKNLLPDVCWKDKNNAERSLLDNQVNSTYMTSTTVKVNVNRYI